MFWRHSPIRGMRSCLMSSRSARQYGRLRASISSISSFSRLSRSICCSMPVFSASCGRPEQAGFARSNGLPDSPYSGCCPLPCSSPAAATGRPRRTPFNIGRCRRVLSFPTFTLRLKHQPPGENQHPSSSFTEGRAYRTCREIPAISVSLRRTGTTSMSIRSWAPGFRRGWRIRRGTAWNGMRETWRKYANRSGPTR